MKKDVRITSVSEYAAGFSLVIVNEKAQAAGTLIVTTEEYEKLGSPTPRTMLTVQIERTKPT